jgi:hypothetical protein
MKPIGRIKILINYLWLYFIVGLGVPKPLKLNSRFQRLELLTPEKRRKEIRMKMSDKAFFGEIISIKSVEFSCNF